MANHPQLGTALSNVAELNNIYLLHQREALREAEEEERAAATAAKRASKESKRSKKKKGKKEKKKKEKKKEKKSKKKDAKESKEKEKEKVKGGHCRRRDDDERAAASGSDDSSDEGGNSDSDSGSSSDSERSPSRQQQRQQQQRTSSRDELARGRAAAEAARHILAKFPETRGDLRGLLHTVDDGEAVAIEGIPDERLRALLSHLFDNLGLRKSAKTGAHLLPKGAPKVSVKLALIFDMTAEQLAPFARARSPWRQPEPKPESAKPSTAGRGGGGGGEDGNDLEVRTKKTFGFGFRGVVLHVHASPPPPSSPHPDKTFYFFQPLSFDEPPLSFTPKQRYLCRPLGAVW